MLKQPEDDKETDSLKKDQEALRADPFERMIAEQLNPTNKNEEEEARIAEADQIEDQVRKPPFRFHGRVGERSGSGLTGSWCEA